MYTTELIALPHPQPASDATSAWQRRNVITVRALGVVLVLAAAIGELTPPGTGPLSGVRPYNVFHLVAGAAALLVAWSGRTRAAARFNLAFGAIDLYQAIAGVFGLAPAHLFALGPADHVVHVVIGAALVAVAWPAVTRSR